MEPGQTPSTQPTTKAPASSPEDARAPGARQPVICSALSRPEDIRDGLTVEASAFDLGLEVQGFERRRARALRSFQIPEGTSNVATRRPLSNTRALIVGRGLCGLL